MIIDDKSATKPAARPEGARVPPRGPPGAAPRGENVPPRGRGQPPSHRPTRSQEEALKARRMQERNGSTGERNIFDSPPKRTERRPRRNSESSAMDIERPLTEEERKQKELRRRERERRHREGKDKSGKPSRKLDLIDQLDATSIYGTGCKSLITAIHPPLDFHVLMICTVFHHDGPFDALNPHRNRKGTRHAPMQAFPKDSLNNSIGGSGPLNAKPDHKTFLGKHDDEAFLDYNKSRDQNSGYVDEPEAVKKRNVPAVWDPHSRGSILHGDETLGLGTSTFLEGTPAAQTVIQRRQAESAQDSLEQGIQRKKSLAQRIRGMNSRPANGRGAYGPRSGELPSSNSTGERNPFFNEFDRNEERITVRQQDSNPMSPVSPNSPPRSMGLERRATTDASAAVSPEPVKTPGVSAAFLTRVKSLKGGRRQRPDPPQATGYTPAGASVPDSTA